ncbi:nudC domain-containing protein 3-like isoform X2 [Tubulanus polymorphus]|uniref:nudC domain-containing protein 3-like isoform X2 n=1 Tax=Tubulanus polymorphus TaxID=672921 RepID=UPI003DA5D46F
MAAPIEKYDSALLGILQNEGQISNFLEVIFGFLYRRTDFYYVMKGEGEKLGFPPGIAAKIAYSAFKKFDTKAEEDRNVKEAAECPVQPTPAIKDDVPPPAVVEYEVESTKPEVTTNSESCRPVSSTTTSQQNSKTTAASDTTHKNTANSIKEMDDSKPETYVSNPECYNGAVRDNYSWSQSITDLDIRVKVPSTVQKGKQVTVDVRRKHLKVCVNDEVMLDDDLSWEVHKDDSIWSLVPGEHVHINLDKIQERWWDSLIVNEEKINVRKIDASRPITDLDDEAQAKIEEMMFNERQKRLGLPQSHEKNVHDVLKKAWNIEGSPFKGTPYDPSSVQIGNNSSTGPHCAD